MLTAEVFVDKKRKTTQSKKGDPETVYELDLKSSNGVVAVKIKIDSQETLEKLLEVKFSQIMNKRFTCNLELHEEEPKVDYRETVSA